MRKNAIYASRWNNSLFVDFFYKSDSENIYLFTTRYNKQMFLFFQNGKSISQIKSIYKWNQNKKLDRLIERRLPYEFKILKRKGVKLQ